MDALEQRPVSETDSGEQTQESIILQVDIALYYCVYACVYVSEHVCV